MLEATCDILDRFSGTKVREIERLGGEIGHLGGQTGRLGGQTGRLGGWIERLEQRISSMLITLTMTGPLRFSGYMGAMTRDATTLQTHVRTRILHLLAGSATPCADQRQLVSLVPGDKECRWAPT